MPDTGVKYGDTFAAEPMSQERGSYLRNWSQGVASMAFWFKKKVTIGQQGTEKVQNKKRPLDSQNSVSEKQTEKTAAANIGHFSRKRKANTELTAMRITPEQKQD